MKKLTKNLALMMMAVLCSTMVTVQAKMDVKETRATFAEQIAANHTGFVSVDLVQQKLTGTVKWFNPQKGFGYISRDDGGRDVWVHFSAIKPLPGDPNAFRKLEADQRVQFELGNGPGGQHAANVVTI